MSTWVPSTAPSQPTIHCSQLFAANLDKANGHFTPHPVTEDIIFCARTQTTPSATQISAMATLLNRGQDKFMLAALEKVDAL